MKNRARRDFLKRAAGSFGILGATSLWPGVLLAKSSYDTAERFRLGQPDQNGVRLPRGFSSRVVARSSQPVVASSDYHWHAAPDGGACFPAADGGWIYVSNSEMKQGKGGAGAIVFDANGTITDAYPVLQGTHNNCAGGATPWNSWLSCEEVDAGRVWECDPAGKKQAVVRPALGIFKHEAAAVDPENRQLYMTEDQPDGCLYRYTPLTSNNYNYNLVQGRLEVAVVDDITGFVDWVEVPDPSARKKPTRYQVAAATHFDGGEGIAWDNDKIYFTTKGDNRVWEYSITSGSLDVIYDAADHATPVLTGVDNVTVSQSGDIYIAEDGGDLQIVALDSWGKLFPVMQLVGHTRSEIAGPAFSPDGKRLYFSSQRGSEGRSESGITYEISGF